MQEIEPNIIVKEYVKIPLMEINSIINDNTISDNEKITKIKELINEYRNNNEKIF